MARNIRVVQGKKARSYSGPSSYRWNWPLPDAARVGAHHLVARLAAECLLKFGHVGNDAIDAVLARRVRISAGPQPCLLRRYVLAPDLAVGDEEALVGGEAVDR